MAGRKDFLNMPAPENYVAGLGRGATGFTTRSDLGPAREGPSEEQIKDALAKRAKELGTSVSTQYAPDKKAEENEDDDERFQDPENEVGLFANGIYDKDDDEADRIYQAVDQRMEKRRRQRRLVSLTPTLPRRMKRMYLCFSSREGQIADLNTRTSREEREKQEREEYEQNNPKIQQQFADLKRALGTVTDEDWASIPEVGDLTGKNRRSKQNLRQRFYAVPDSVIKAGLDSTQLNTTIGDDGTQTNGTNGESADAADGTVTNFAHLGAARNKVLQVRLDQQAQDAIDAASGTATSVDTKGYLTSLVKSEMKAAEIPVGDVNRVRELLDSVIKTNPKFGPGWIACALLEQNAGKIAAARNVIARGCQMCPKNEDVWIQAINLNDNHNAKIIAANAIKNNEQSTRLWAAAVDLEQDNRSKRRVVQKAIDHIPRSEELWKKLINLTDDEKEARLLLAKSTEIIPLSESLWLASAHLAPPDDAQKILNQARRAIPTSSKIWIAAAILQEQLGKTDMVGKIMDRAVKGLAKESAMLKREEWISKAEECDADGHPLTAGAIIAATFAYGLEEDEDRKDLYLQDAKDSMNRGRYETARAMYAYALREYPSRRNIWEAAANLEKLHGTQQSLRQLLDKAVESVPNSEELWLLNARESQRAEGFDSARRVLARAFQQLPQSENIWLAAVELEEVAEAYDKARELLQTARDQAGTNRVWYKSVAFERRQGNTDEALDLVNRGLQIYPGTPQLHLQKGQIYEYALSKIPQAREAYSTGTRACSKSVALYLHLARLEEKSGLLVKARSVLDRARLQIPKSPELYTESVRLERRAGNTQAAQNMMAKALQEVPTSGLLWTEKIWHLEARTQRKPRALEAIKKVDNDPILFVTVARIFWGERRLEKAANWFEKALLLDPDLGDSWAWYWKFLLQHGTPEKMQDVLGKLAITEPRHGEIWASVRKDPRNARLTTEGVLKKVVAVLD